MSLLLSSSLLSAISTPSEFLRVIAPTHLKKQQLKRASNLTRRLGFGTTSNCRRLRTRVRNPTRCCLDVSTVALDSSPREFQDSLMYCRAYWVSESVIAWNVDARDFSCYLYASRTAALSISTSGIQGHDVKVELGGGNDRLPEHVIEKFPHIRNYKAFKVPPAFDAKNLLKCQLAIAILSSNGNCISATGLQLQGVLDELFSYNGPLGAVIFNEAVSLYLWAPTAQVVHALIYRDSSGSEPVEVVRLVEINGVWSGHGPRNWEGCYYVYEVSVYHHSTLKIEKCIANDPYARGLSSNGKRTLVIDLDSDSLKPDGWDNLANEKPDLLSFTDISIYELHIRDFSANDCTVDPEFRGGYLAFTCQESAGMRHLKKLSNAGITHVHLLPTFQFGDVQDEKEKWKWADIKMLQSLPPDSIEQQAHITEIQNEDGYNWGYNPVLWGVPKGSYTSNPNGKWRTIEFRKMVQGLNHIGLRVVLDVVYNHLHGSGPFDEYSVLDKIVPGYYLRRNTDGGIENSTCVNNTASEHYMVERLILDDLICWAVHYKVDGFRFDLMGHLMKRTMMKAKSMLQGLLKDKSGVDGSTIYIYGEGWDFGEVAKNGRGVNASQFNLYGTGIGSFNDRIRDALRGGSPFGHPLQQGFVTGLFLEPNGHDHGTEAAVKHTLAILRDHIQVGMAGNLRDFVLTNCDGQEVNYVSAHDNETLFDIVSLKTLMELSVDEHCKINHLAMSIIALSQGIPFFHAGDEMLRSKSLDCDSYNSGDWFNRLDFSYSDNNWGVGLPPKEKNENNWPLIKPRLADPSFKPQSSHILAAIENFSTLLKIRYSSPLFRLPTLNAIQERVHFHNAGSSWVPGVIVMSIEDGNEGVAGLSQLDPNYSHIVVFINVRPTEVSFAIPSLQGKTFQLHPLQMMSTDSSVLSAASDAYSGSFTVPPRTTAVFVQPRNI